MVYDLQNQYVGMQNQIRETEKLNEDLRSKIIKASSIKELAEKSKEMELQTVNREDYIEVDLSVNHFSDGVAVTEEKSLSEQILSLIPFEFAH